MVVRPMRFFRAIVCLLFSAGVLCGATADPSGVVVRVWQSQDGLPSNVVRSVVQSGDGYLWVATAEGVARFDGFDFELIEPEGEMRRFRLAFSRLFSTAAGDVWAATYQGGLFRVQGHRLKPVLENMRRPNPPLVTQVIEDPAGGVFFKRGDETGRVNDRGVVQAVAPSAELDAWFAKDLEVLSAGGRSPNAGTSPVLKDHDGRIWTAGASGELTVTEPGGEGGVVDFPQRGQAFGINELMLDREGNVWVASPVNGLARIRHARVDLPDIDPNTSERAMIALLEDRSGAWWVASRRGGVIRWTREETQHFEFSSARFIRPAAALFEDKESRLWVASRDGSVYLREKDEFVPQFVKTQVPSKVRSITQDANGTFWFAGTQGLASFSGGQVRRYGKADGFPETDTTIVQPFPGGGIIFGDASGRVMWGDGRSFKILAPPEIMNHQWISGILPVSAKEVWVSTLGSGLFLWNGKTWRGFSSDDGLPDLRLTCVIADDSGNLWMGSLGGIIRGERNELLERARTKDSAIHWLRLDHTDGMPSRECIGGFQPAGWKAKDGRLWFPTGGGVVRVRPDLAAPDKTPPPVYLQSARANGIVHLGMDGPVITDPGRSRLEFRFVGLCYGAPEKTTYRARLKGLDESWRELGNQRVAAFEAVPPGDYTFEVMAVNGDGIRSVVPARIQVIVTPHFWQTPWFYLTAGALVLAAAAGTGWFGARTRMKVRIQALKIRNAREAERARIARDLHDDLGASLTEISILAALAAEDAEKTPLQPSLDQLSAKAKHVVSGLDEIVWAVNPREDTLRSLVDYIAAFAREFLDIARMPLRVDVTGEIPDVPLAAAQRHGVFLAAREALNNIVKHSGAKEVNLHVTTSEELLEIRIEDNGRGFEPDYATGGEGLGNLRVRMQEAGGDCRIDTHPGQGTVVFLTLPLHPEAKPLS